MNATRRMKWYWSGAMLGILILLIGLLKVLAHPPVVPISPVSDARLSSLVEQVE